MERVTVFLDLANIEASAPGRVDYKALHRYLGEGRYLQEAYAYVPVDPRLPRDVTALSITCNRAAGWSTPRWASLRARPTRPTWMWK